MIAYIKAPPTSWLMQFSNGTAKRAGAGLSFFYWAPTTTLVKVPLSSIDVPFAFTELSSDFQTLTIQGQLSFRVAEPKKLCALLDYSIARNGEYRTDDPQKLSDRLISATQIATRATVSKLTLREALSAAEQVVEAVLLALKGSEAIGMLGVEVLTLAIVSVRPTPEMARALEAEAREALQRKSDEAIFARRNAAVEHERTIKESELQTEVMVEQQRRHIRETKMAADIAMEKEREQLIAQKAANDRTAADAQAYGLEAQLKPVRELDWKVLTALAGGQANPAGMLAVAFRELAENAHKIGELNVSPDLLRALLPSSPEPSTEGPRDAREARRRST